MVVSEIMIIIYYDERAGFLPGYTGYGIGGSWGGAAIYLCYDMNRNADDAD